MTLVHGYDAEWYVSRALRSLSRTEDGMAPIVEAIHRIDQLSGFDEGDAVIDTSVDMYRGTMLGWFVGVGIDPELAEALVELDFDPESWPVYPDAPDVVHGIRTRGCSTALVSDFHADVVPHLASHGIDLDAAVLSFEHGFQKPDPRMFTTALDALRVDPHEALMVGDRVARDGGAAAVGIDTLILPAPAQLGPRGLDAILGLLG